jgi:hypothetical protein
MAKEEVRICVERYYPCERCLDRLMNVLIENKQQEMGFKKISVWARVQTPLIYKSKMGKDRLSGVGEVGWDRETQVQYG